MGKIWNIAEFLRTAYFIEQHWWLLLALLPARTIVRHFYHRKSPTRRE